jgi:NAD+ kinase
MKIAIYGKSYNNAMNHQVDSLLQSISAAGFGFSIYEKYAAFLSENGFLKKSYPTFTREDIKIKDYCCLVSVGGDGTLLDTVTIIGDSGIPVVGMNAGRLGFISSIAIEEFTEILNTLKDGSFECDERSLIQVDTDRNLFGDMNFGLNELTVIKKDTASMIQIETHLNDIYLNTYWADGIIIATPTGSTAYSLSCGGPIIFPGSTNIVVTPIAPHNLNVRPVVVANDTKLSIRMSGRSDEFLIALDSRSDIVYPNEEIRISKAPFRFKLIQPPTHNFANTMRNKLGWGLDKRN